MKSQAFIFLLVGLLLGISGTAVAMKRSEAVSPQMTAASNMPATGSMPVMNMGSDSSSSSKANDGSMTDSSMTMDDMMTNLIGDKGIQPNPLLSVHRGEGEGFDSEKAT